MAAAAGQLVKLNGKQATVPVHGDMDYDPECLDDICKQINTRPRSIQ
jgi:predicted RNA binding protein YcfA (HicA-like mRNA interferase family)